MMEVKQAYDESPRDGLRCVDISLCVVSAQEESDINTIVRRFGLTGQLPNDVAMPQFVEFEDVYDFHSAMNVVADANSAFMKMPADVRARFRNDPNEFLYFANDARNWKEAKALGLLVPEAVDPDARTIVPGAAPPAV